MRPRTRENSEISALPAFRRHVGLAGNASESEDRHARLARDDLALLTGADADERPRRQIPALDARCQPGASLQDDVDLFLLFMGVIVVGIIPQFGGSFRTFIPNDVTPNPLPAYRN